MLAVLGLPAGYNFGIDMKMWTTGEKFTGVRGITPGIHYVYYSTPDDEVRQGFFVSIDSNNTAYYRKWCTESESLIQIKDDQDRISLEAMFSRDFRYISGLAAFDQCMDEATIGSWQTATRFVTSELVERIQPINSLAFKSLQQSSEELMSRDVPTIYFTEVGKVRVPTGASSSEITQAHMDKTLQLEQFLHRASYSNSLDPIGELQAAFVLVLLGQNYDAFVQWRKMLEMFLGCKENGIRCHATLFDALASCLQFQMQQLPDDFLFDAGMTDDDVPHDRKNHREVFVLQLMADFVLTCSDDSLSDEVELQRAVQELDKILADKYGNEWTGLFSPENDEDVPVIVS